MASQSFGKEKIVEIVANSTPFVYIRMLCFFRCFAQLRHTA